MTKKIFTLLLTCALLTGTPFATSASARIEIVEVEPLAPTLSIQDSRLHITDAAGLTLQIYNLTGEMVMRVKIDSPDKYIDIDLGKGCYIVKVGKTVRKISIP